MVKIRVQGTARVVVPASSDPCGTALDVIKRLMRQIGDVHVDSVESCDYWTAVDTNNNIVYYVEAYVNVFIDARETIPADVLSTIRAIMGDDLRIDLL